MKKIIKLFYAAPDGFLKSLLFGCEMFVLLAVAAIVFRVMPYGALGLGDTLELSEAVGSAAVRCLAISVMVGSAVGIVSVAKPD